MVLNDREFISSYQNDILRRVTEEDIRSIRPYLSWVNLVRSQVLYENDNPVDTVYFIESGLISLAADTGDSAAVQVAMAGREGFAGTVSMFDDDLTAIHRSTVQITGSAFRMSQAHFQEAVKALPGFNLLCLKHTKTTMLQMSQVAACNARHPVLQRLCRLLLMAQDRVDSTSLVLTQEDLALMLGVRRAGISVAIADLESSHIVRQSRGRLEITDRAKLEGEACKCYSLLRYRNALIMDTI